MHQQNERTTTKEVHTHSIDNNDDDDDANDDDDILHIRYSSVCTPQATMKQSILAHSTSATTTTLSTIIIYVMIGTTTNRVAEDGMEETTTLSIIIIYVMIGTTTNRVAEDGMEEAKAFRIIYVNANPMTDMGWKKLVHWKVIYSDDWHLQQIGGRRDQEQPTMSR